VLLVLTVMPTAVMQLHARIKNSALRHSIIWGMSAFTAFMVVGRIVSGVHWITDIVGGILLSAGLVKLYDALAE
jgi:undecaprenyl-diphosphatase